MSSIWMISDITWRGFSLSHLATVESDQPRVRTMALVAHNIGLWIATKTEWNKVGQIGKNPKIEISLPAREQSGSSCTRINAEATLVRDS